MTKTYYSHFFINITFAQKNKNQSLMTNCIIMCKTSIYQKFLTVLTVLFVSVGVIVGQTADMLQDFENMDTNIALPRFRVEGSGTCSAIVINDPTNPGNKVAYVVNDESATASGLNFRRLLLPEGRVIGDYDFLAFDYYRISGGSQRAYLGLAGEKVWCDPHPVTYGGTEQWNRCTISLEELKGNSSSTLMAFHIGLLGSGSEYYIDNIRLVRDIDYGYDVEEPTTTLRYYADRIGLNLGVAMADGDNFFYSAGRVDNPDCQWTKTFTGLFNTTVCGNEMKWEAIEPRDGVFDFDRPDKLVDLALSKGMKVRGHTLCWQQQLAGWVFNYNTREELLRVLKRHVQTVVGHYKGKVYEWDVVNEIIDASKDDYLGRNHFYNVIGPDYVDSVFVWAHEADPDARLIMNDVMVEYDGDDKAMALFRFSSNLKKRGIPIHGVGFQMHLFWFGAVSSMKSSISLLLKRYQLQGLDVSFTEIDQGIPHADYDKQTAWEAQARDFRALIEIALTAKNVNTVVFWGMTDPYSWIPSFMGYTAGQPLLIDDYMRAKPGYTEILEVLKDYDATTHIQQPETEDKYSFERNDIYTLQGILVGRQLTEKEARQRLKHGIYIIKGKKVIVK